MGLNESFASARGQILMTNPFPSIPQAYSLIKQEERQRQGHTVIQSFNANANERSMSQNTRSHVFALGEIAARNKA